ncbi:hypothetical protein DBR17_13295 [Sphingomonas sp. HMWF008]|nr:hypothetical protein DBR17_13295 [Sphingomonas sp. HMWF008]
MKAAVARCAAQGCTPEKDAAAALALSHAQFLMGEYEAARRTLWAALDRNKASARQHPLPYAALLRARVKIDSHLGEYEDARSGSIRQMILLRDTLLAKDHNAIAARVQLADVNAHIGQSRLAESQYRESLNLALAAGDVPVEIATRFRLAKFWTPKGNGPVSTSDRRKVAEILEPIITAVDDERRKYSVPARMIIARLAERSGNADAINAVLRDAPPGSMTAPQLLSFTPVEFKGRSATCQDELEGKSSANGYRTVDKVNTACHDPRNLVSPIDVDKQWINVGFWITPEGTVRDIEILQRGSAYVGDWSKKVERAIGSRRYAPWRPQSGGPGLYRIERYSMTAPYFVPTGSTLRQHSTQTTLEIADITAW